MRAMGFVEFYYIEAGLVFGLFIAVGLGVLSLKRERINIARGCCWVAAATFVSIAIVWGITTPSSSKIWIPTVGVAAFIAAVGLVAGLRWLNLFEAETAKPAFPYVEAGTTAGQPLRPRFGILLIKGAPSLTNVEVQVFPPGGGMARRFFYPVVYGRGELLMWVEADGLRKIIEFGEGENLILLTDLNGSYFESIKIREEDGKLKRSIAVYKDDKTVPSGNVQLLYENDP
jgi:hypothetical protein